jgi:flagellar hook assembly protein FlgD
VRTGYASLRIYDVSGRLVRTLVDGSLGKGVHELLWDGRDDNGDILASGVYFYRFVLDDFEKTKKMILLR